MAESALQKNPELPDTCLNSQGLRYDPRADIWEMSSTGLARLDLSGYRELCSPTFVQSLKLTLITLNRRLKPTTLANYLGTGLNPLLKQMNKPVRQIEQADVETFIFTLPSERKCWISPLRSLCKELVIHGIPGHSISPDAWTLLQSTKIGDVERGLAAKTWDPVNGPLTPDELDSFIRALHAAFARAEIGTEEYILILLFSSFGARNANLADLKVCDLKVILKEGVTSYQLQIPSVKQRGGRFRQHFYDRRLVPELGALLEGYVSLQKNRHEALYLGENLPMFVDLDNTDPIRSYHRNSCQIKNMAVNVAKRLAVPSLRTGQNLHVNPRRYRYTAATLAWAMGLDPSAIAALLDHGDTRSQAIYAAISPAVLADITKRLEGFRGPLAAAFHGRVAEPAEVLDPQQVVFRAKFRTDIPEPAVGACEASRKCGGRRPYVCYVCPLFTASMEGDHEGALADVLEERVLFDQNAGDSLRFLTADSVVSSIRRVIALVQVRLEEMGKTLSELRQEKERLLRMRGLIP